MAVMQGAPFSRWNQKTLTMKGNSVGEDAHRSVLNLIIKFVFLYNSATVLHKLQKSQCDALF